MKRTAFILCGLMLAASVAGAVLRPSVKTSQTATGPRYVLATSVPTAFGDWHEVPQSALVVDPSTRQLLDKIYSQTLVRTYVNSAGYRIMLSLAYGEDQRGELALHRPEVCYPAQGFTVTRNDEAQIPTPYGAITGRRLMTRLGRRMEPVTYWVTIGNHQVQTAWQKRVVQLQMGLTGRVPDGLLFRVSSIDADPQKAFKVQDDFVTQLLGAVSAPNRLRLSGLGA